MTLNAVTFEEAANYYKSKQYKKSFTAFEELAHLGNVNAQYNVAMFYYKGMGVEQNKILAFIWFDTAARAGNKFAQNRLGYMFEKGEVKGTQDQVKATKQFLKAALQNYDVAQLNLAMKYNNNISEKSLKRAFFWYEKAAKQGNLPAMNNLANMYYHGQTVKKDYKKAYDLYFEAASKGDSIAQFNIAMMYYNGEYVKQSDKNTLTWLTLSAKSGYAMAQVRLGNFYREGYALVKQDFKKALTWYYEAAKQKYAPGQYYVGYCYYYGYGVKENHQKAAFWMHLAKENGYDHAETFMKRKKLYY